MTSQLALPDQTNSCAACAVEKNVKFSQASHKRHDFLYGMAAHRIIECLQCCENVRSRIYLILAHVSIRGAVYSGNFGEGAHFRNVEPIGLSGSKDLV